MSQEQGGEQAAHGNNGLLAGQAQGDRATVSIFPAGDDAGNAVTLSLQSLGPETAEQEGSPFQCARNVAHIGGLFGVRGTPKLTQSLAVTALGVAHQRLALQEAVGGGAPVDKVADGADGLCGGLLHTEHALHALEPGSHGLFGEGLQSLLSPALQHRRRRAHAGAGIDGRGAAHIASHRYRDDGVAGGHGCSPAAVELGDHLGEFAGEVAAIVILAFLDDHHGQATTGQFIGCCRAAGAAAQNHHVCFQGHILVAIPGGGDLLLPAEGLDLGGQLHGLSAAGGLFHLLIQHIGGLEGQGQQAQQLAGHRSGGQFVEKTLLLCRPGTMKGAATHQTVTIVEPQQTGFQAALQACLVGQLRIHPAQQDIGICCRQALSGRKQGTAEGDGSGVLAKSERFHDFSVVRTERDACLH